MNPTLAAIYGLDKTASDESTDLDLNQISGAELLAGLEDGTIALEGGEEIEKEAGDELDLSDLTGAELIEIMDQLEDEDEPLNKVAGDEYLMELGGRIMAHAYADEMSKLASDEGDYYDLSEISAEDTIALLESGEFELVDGEIEKDAGARVDRALELLSGSKVRKQLAQVRKGTGEGRAQSWINALRGSTPTRARFKHLPEEARKSLAAQTAAGATAIGGVGGAAALIRRRKKGRK